MGTRDTLIHVEKMLAAGFGHQELRELITEVTGLASDLPQKAATGCGKRRDWAMISRIPENVTCQQCRAHAREELLRLAASTEALLSIPHSSRYVPDDRKREEMAAEARYERALAARYEQEGE